MSWWLPSIYNFVKKRFISYIGLGERNELRANRQLLDDNRLLRQTVKKQDEIIQVQNEVIDVLAQDKSSDNLSTSVKRMRRKKL